MAAAVTLAQHKGLVAIRDRRVWRWSNGKWANTGGVHGNVLNGLLRRGLVELHPVPEEPCADAKLSEAGRAALAGAFV